MEVKNDKKNGPYLFSVTSKLRTLNLKPPKVYLRRDLVSERYVLHSSVLSHKNHS